MAHIFSSADILLPKERSNENCKAYSVIACDQFTSDPGYWENAAQIRQGSASALDLVLPEAYLGTDAEKLHKEDAEEAAEGP